MQQLTPLDVYLGVVPLKTDQTPVEFTTNVQNYLNYFNDKFTPQTNILVGDMNILSEELEYLSTLFGGAINYKGIYSSTIVYKKGDSVSIGAAQYISNIEPNPHAPTGESDENWLRVDKSKRLEADLDANGHVIFNNTLGSQTGFSLDLEKGNFLSATLEQDEAIEFLNIPAGTTRWYIELSANGYTVVWPESVSWPDEGYEPNWNETNVETAFFYSTDGGENIRGLKLGGYKEASPKLVAYITQGDAPMTESLRAWRLDGSLSYSSSNPPEPFTYAWNLEKPTSSTTYLRDDDTLFPYLYADVEGTYTATLTIYTETETSSFSVSTITMENVTPYHTDGTWEGENVLDGNISNLLRTPAYNYSWYTDDSSVYPYSFIYIFDTATVMSMIVLQGRPPSPSYYQAPDTYTLEIQKENEENWIEVANVVDDNSLLSTTAIIFEFEEQAVKKMRMVATSAINGVTDSRMVLSNLFFFKKGTL